jgi:thymidylate synthase (FAD)
MKIWTEPQVDLVAITQLMGSFPEEFGWESDSDVDLDSLPEFAGRLCYLSFGAGGEVDGHKTIAGRSSNQEYLDNIKKTKHGSVIEHSNFTFLFQGISRTLSHELVRHRHLSFSQLSQRYVDESGVGFVCPPAILVHPNRHVYSAWEAACRKTVNEYSYLLYLLTPDPDAAGKVSTAALKEARGAARSVLGACAETKIVVTGNTRAWRHFLFLRGAETADAEIRRLAFDVGMMLKDLAPASFSDWEPTADGGIVSEYGSF